MAPSAAARHPTATSPAETQEADKTHEEAAKEAFGDAHYAGKRGEKMQPRIGVVSAVAMLTVAGLMDMVQFFVSFLHVIPIVGNGIAVLVAWFIAFIAAFIFWLWFMGHGVDYLGGKQAARKMLTALSAVVIEIIPIIDALPAITGGVLLMIIFSRMEEEEFLRDATALARGVARVTGRIQSAERRRPPGYEGWSDSRKNTFEKAHSMEADALGTARGRRQRTPGEEWRDEYAPGNDNNRDAANNNARGGARAFDIVKDARPYDRDAVQNTQN